MDFLVSLGVGKERDKGRGGFSADHAPMAPPAARHREITEVNICSGEQMFTCDLFDGSKIPIHAEPVQQEAHQVEAPVPRLTRPPHPPGD